MDCTQLVRQITKDNQIHTIDVVAPDQQGVMRSKQVPIQQFFEHTIDHGVGLCNVAFTWDIQGDPVLGQEYASWETGWPEVWLKPDLTTFRVVPWRKGYGNVIADVYENDGSLVKVYPRYVLKKVIERMTRLGYKVCFGGEIEYFILNDKFEPIDEGYYPKTKTMGIQSYCVSRQGLMEYINFELRDAMEKMGVNVEAHNAEYCPGQYEINFKYADALTVADWIFQLKNAAHEIARKHNVYITFMAKVDKELAGSGMHLHQSLWDFTGKTNVFAGSNQSDFPYSDQLKHYVAGLMATVRDFFILYNSTGNAYRRTGQKDTFCPTTNTWSFDNRTVLNRVLGRDKMSRVEFRVPAADSNIYLLHAACIAGGLHGLENKLELPSEPFAGNAHNVPNKDIILPTDMCEAIDLFYKSEIAREYFGDEFVEVYAATARHEYTEFNKIADVENVNDAERHRYLEWV